jgi:hypothetical protein
LSLFAIGVASRNERVPRVHLLFNTSFAARDTGDVTQRRNPEPDPLDHSEPSDSGPSDAGPGQRATPPERSVVDEPAAEDRDIGWGDHDRGDGLSDEWYRRERPPHHG